MMPEQQIWAVARNIRAFLEPVWVEWHIAWNHPMPATPLRWTCTRTSYFMQIVLLRDMGIPSEWISGAPRIGDEAREIDAFGFYSSGGWQPHAWIVIGERWIVDITADQFSCAPIIVTAVDDARYQKGGDETVLPVISDKSKATVEKLWPLWEVSEMRGRMLNP